MFALIALCGAAGWTVPTAGCVRAPPLLMKAGAGFGKKPVASAAAAPKAPPPAATFSEWATSSGVKLLEDLAIGEFEGERGVVAGSEVVAGARIVTVPAKLALQVTNVQKCPAWCDEAAWKASRWDAKLAMTLLHERSDGSSALQPWFAQMPPRFCTPVLWAAPEAAFDAIGYPVLSASVARQRSEWVAAAARAPGAPSAEEWTWAMNVVRSRAFSGPYAGGTFVGALAKLFLASTLAGGLAIGGLDAELALNGFLVVSLSVVLSDLVFLPRLSKAKRFVLCPWIDMLNHDGALGGSEVAYEYFSDAFAARLDADAPPTAAGAQVLISYGARSNDVLLQYYGFVQADNPHDAYALTQEALILQVDALRPLPADAIGAIRDAGLIDAAAPVALTAAGCDDVAVRLVRLLAHPSLARQADGGRDALADRAAEADALRLLAAVAEARLAATPLEAAVAEGAAGEFGEAAALLGRFVGEKRKVLQASAAALERRAGEAERA